MDPATEQPAEQQDTRGVLLTLTLVSIAFAAILRPFYGTILWGLLIGLGTFEFADLVVALYLAFFMIRGARASLIGKDTGMPAYLAMISTFGGIAVFGLNGFVLGPAIAALFIAIRHMHVDSRPLLRDDA